jgi:hypothetical protein
LVAVCLVLLALACANPNVAPSPSPSVGVTRAVYAWMQCQDCLDGERNRVVALGDSAVPMLQGLLSGPPVEHMNAVRRSIEELAARMPAPRMPSQITIDQQLAVFHSMYVGRAASALAGIGDSLSRKALCDARATNLAPVDRRAVDAAIMTIGGTCP